MSQHTQGPWQMHLVRVQRVIIDQHGGAIAYTHGENISADVDEANARLIAAAPDLLAACVEFVRKVDSGQARSEKSYAQMVAAIAKATGEQA